MGDYVEKMLGYSVESGSDAGFRRDVVHEEDRKVSREKLK